MSKIIEIAEKEIGYTELLSNKTKYGKWFGLDGVPWCGIFVSWVYAQAGQQLPPIGFTKGFAGCQTAVAWFTRNRMLTKTPKPGDIVFFDFNGDKRYDHTGIFVAKDKWDPGRFETIEGNTSMANQANGGSVMRRSRSFKQAIFVSTAKEL